MKSFHIITCGWFYKITDCHLPVVTFISSQLSSKRFSTIETKCLQLRYSKRHLDLIQFYLIKVHECDTEIFNHKNVPLTIILSLLLISNSLLN